MATIDTSELVRRLRMGRLYASQWDESASAIEALVKERDEALAESSDWRNGDLRGVQLHLESATRSNAALREALCSELNVTDEELLRIRNRCEGTGYVVKISAKMLQKIVDSVRHARAALSGERDE